MVAMNGVSFGDAITIQPGALRLCLYSELVCPLAIH